MSLASPPRWAAGALLAVSLAATFGAARRMSTTFDEIVLAAGGARGYATGRFDLAPDHPPLMQYVYGLPVFLDSPRYPVEQPGLWGSLRRYEYAREFFFRSGNDPERLALVARLPGLLLAGALSLVVWAYCRRAWGAGAALLATALVAFLPDVLAHGGVAYNDVPLALAFFAALWAADVAARRPGVANGALAGALAALALGVKFSAVALGPAAVLLVFAEALARGADREWRRRLLVAAAASLLAGYVVLVVIYRGDFALAGFQDVLHYKMLQASAGRNSPGYLLGEVSRAGWWYYFPVAFLFKTPAAFQVLLCFGAVGLLRAEGSWRERLRSPLRPMLAGALVFLVSLASARKDIGFRYALPMLPLLAVLIAAGAMRLWAGRARIAIAGLAVWHAVSSLSYYPDFLAYTSEYVPSRDRGHEVLVDSNLDWGQGLLELREFLRQERVPCVYLSYFGSALPEGYGIEYVALPSFFPLSPPPLAPGTPPPSYAVVSATNLVGAYLEDDPLARFRRLQPVRVLGHTLFVYRVAD